MVKSEASLTRTLLAAGGLHAGVSMQIVAWHDDPESVSRDLSSQVSIDA